MQRSPPHIVVVEDEPVTRAKIAGYLAAAGYRASEAESAEQVRAILSRDPADVLLIDINLPGEDGFELTRSLRAKSEVAIIMVTGRTDEVDRIVGLEIGADDYVAKPFNQRELLARVKNVLRRSRGHRPPEAALKRFAGWSFDLLRRRLTTAGGEIVDLTRAEFDLLSLFVRNPGVVLGRERIMRHVANRDWMPYDRTADVLVRRLRVKLGDQNRDEKIIVTAHGEGYVFVAELE